MLTSSLFDLRGVPTHFSYVIFKRQFDELNLDSWPYPKSAFRTIVHRSIVYVLKISSYFSTITFDNLIKADFFS